jgi:uncharacterized caspase-like protein
MRALITLVLLLAISSWGHATSLTGTRVALVVGNGAYQNVPELPNPPHDAHDVADELKKIGFSVTNLTDAKFEDLHDALRKFTQQARGAKLRLFITPGTA